VESGLGGTSFFVLLLLSLPFTRVPPSKELLKSLLEPFAGEMFEADAGGEEAAPLLLAGVIPKFAGIAAAAVRRTRAGDELRRCTPRGEEVSLLLPCTLSTGSVGTDDCEEDEFAVPTPLREVVGGAPLPSSANVLAGESGAVKSAKSIFLRRSV
jgi:hypothetical protein